MNYIIRGPFHVFKQFYLIYLDQVMWKIGFFRHVTINIINLTTKNFS